jgi:ssDNA-binding Zn-finger/Zn-ribbon topoisomerase 1
MMVGENGMSEDVKKCPKCGTEMKVYDGGAGNVWICPNKGCDQNAIQEFEVSVYQRFEGVRLVPDSKVFLPPEKRLGARKKEILDQAKPFLKGKKY